MDLYEVIGFFKALALCIGLLRFAESILILALLSLLLIGEPESANNLCGDSLSFSKILTDFFLGLVGEFGEPTS
jgi:hypothetical protein